jgi:hypothetical protein
VVYHCFRIQILISATGISRNVQPFLNDFPPQSRCTRSSLNSQHPQTLSQASSKLPGFENLLLRGYLYLTSTPSSIIIEFGAPLMFHLMCTRPSTRRQQILHRLDPYRGSSKLRWSWVGAVRLLFLFEIDGTAACSRRSGMNQFQIRACG